MTRWISWFLSGHTAAACLCVAASGIGAGSARAYAAPGAPAPSLPDQASSPPLRIVDRNISSSAPGFYCAIHTDTTCTAGRLVAPGQASDDGGQRWNPYAVQPDFHAGLPYGYRRDAVSSLLDPASGRIITILNALDTPGLDPNINEPEIAQQTLYLRYRVSCDAGRSWRFEEPLIQSGAFDTTHPVEGVWLGKNSVYLGDVGCVPILTRDGHVLVPVQMTVAQADGTLLNPSGGHSYTETAVLIGTWTDGDRLQWTMSQRVQADPKRTTRGLIEPTLAELPDGHILMVMRGSNGGGVDPDFRLPSHKWACVSEDGGKSWSTPQPWTYEDGSPFFSPSSMSALFRHSSGRIFWAGNLTQENCQGNLPRCPLVIGEVDTKNACLIRNSVLVLDTLQDADKTRGRLDLSHLSMVEDRRTGQIVVCYLRYHHEGEDFEYGTVRVAAGAQTGAGNKAR